MLRRVLTAKAKTKLPFNTGMPGQNCGQTINCDVLMALQIQDSATNGTKPAVSVRRPLHFQAVFRGLCAEDL